MRYLWLFLVLVCYKAGAQEDKIWYGLHAGYWPCNAIEGGLSFKQGKGRFFVAGMLTQPKLEQELLDYIESSPDTIATQIGLASRYRGVTMGFGYAVTRSVSIYGEMSFLTQKKYTGYLENFPVYTIRGDTFGMAPIGLGASGSFVLYKGLEVYAGYHTVKKGSLGLRVYFASQ